MRKNNWACFLLILAGIVIGGFIGLGLYWLEHLAWAVCPVPPPEC